MGNKKTKRKSHKLLKIFLCLLFTVIIALCVLAVWQRENIGAFIRAQNTSQEDIASEIATSKANTQKEIEKYNIPIKRDFTLEEEEEIRKGTLSVDEAVRRIMGKPAQSEEKADLNESSEKITNNGNDAVLQEDTSLTEEEQIIANHLKEMYSLKAYYIGQLGAFEKDLKAQYKSTYGNTKNVSAIASVVQNNMSRIINLESECDTEVNKVLTDMKNELNAIGADTGIVQVVEDSYINEKSLRKSYYLSLYN